MKTVTFINFLKVWAWLLAMAVFTTAAWCARYGVWPWSTKGRRIADYIFPLMGIYAVLFSAMLIYRWYKQR